MTEYVTKQEFTKQKARLTRANNSGDPLYIDSVSYDVLFLAQRAPRLDLGNFAVFQRCFTGADISFYGDKMIIHDLRPQRATELGPGD